MILRFTDELLADFQRRCEKWQKTGTVRTHVARARAPVKAPAPKVRLAERDVLRCSLEILDNHPAVAFAWRQNTGLAMGGQHAVRFSFVGCSDILGMLRGGRFLAVECKATGKVPSPEQQAFLDNVNAAGGIAICVDDPQQLIDALEGFDSTTGGV